MTSSGELTANSMDAAEARAFEFSRNCVCISEVLPEQVFSRGFSCYLFLAEDYIFSSDFITCCRSIIELEGSSAICILNADDIFRGGLRDSSVFFIKNSTSAEEFLMRLRVGGPESGWIFGMDRFTCSSDTGNWCIYVEKMNGVAVIGLKNSGDLDGYKRIFRGGPALKISELVGEDATAIYPYSDLVPEWKDGLLRNYG